MRTQQVPPNLRALAADAPRHLAPGRPMRLCGGGGWITVVSGSVWLTRLDDFEDHWLSAGQAMRVDPARALVVEAWDHAPAQITWHAAHAPATAAQVEDAVRALARRSASALLPVARSFAALAEAVVVRLGALSGTAAASRGDNPRLGNDEGRADGGRGGRAGAGSSAWA